MTCRYCKGTKKIAMLTGFVDCECVTAPAANFTVQATVRPTAPSSCLIDIPAAWGWKLDPSNLPKDLAALRVEDDDVSRRTYKVELSSTTGGPYRYSALPHNVVELLLYHFCRFDTCAAVLKEFDRYVQHNCRLTVPAGHAVVCVGGGGGGGSGAVPFQVATYGVSHVNVTRLDLVKDLAVLSYDQIELPKSLSRFEVTPNGDGYEVNVHAADGRAVRLTLSYHELKSTLYLMQHGGNAFEHLLELRTARRVVAHDPGYDASTLEACGFTKADVDKAAQDCALAIANLTYETRGEVKDIVAGAILRLIVAKSVRTLLGAQYHGGAAVAAGGYYKIKEKTDKDAVRLSYVKETCVGTLPCSTPNIQALPKSFDRSIFKPREITP